MITIVLVIHLLLAISLVGVVLLQRSEGGGLGMGGGMGGFMTGRATADLLTRSTAIIAGCFLGTSLLLAILADRGREKTSILDRPVQSQTDSLIPRPAEPAAPVSK